MCTAIRRLTCTYFERNGVYIFHYFYLASSCTKLAFTHNRTYLCTHLIMHIRIQDVHKTYSSMFVCIRTTM